MNSINKCDYASERRNGEILKKKFYLGILAIVLFVGNCMALDVAGLGYKGSEAKKVISDAALEGDLLYFIFNAPSASVAIQLTIADQILVDVYSKIDDSKYYSKTDVINCADDVRNYAYVLISDASQTTLISSHCSNIKPNGAIIK